MPKEMQVVDDKLIITLPLRTQIYENIEDNFTVTGDNLIGVFMGDHNNGIAYRINMSYKGKQDQWTEIVYRTDLPVEEFKQMCRDLKIDYIKE